MSKGLVVTVGNEMMGDDGAGPLLAEMIRRAPLANWEVLEGGNVPENHLFRIRELSPERVIIVDAADMGLDGGEIRPIEKDDIGSLFLMTTHTLPLSYLLEAIREFVPSVEFIGIQPEVVAFGYPVSARVQLAVRRIYDLLARSGEATDTAGASLGSIVCAESDQAGGADEVDCPTQDNCRPRQRSSRQVESHANRQGMAQLIRPL
jgi:hydrogenase 3 maturation protease